MTTAAFAPYRVQLLLARPAAVDGAALAERLGGARANGALLTFDDGATLGLRVSHGVPAEARRALAQTWDWPGAEAALAAAKASVELVLTAPATWERARLLSTAQRAAEAALAQSEALAVHWLPAERLVSPEALRDAMAHGGAPADLGLNVRLFRIGDGRAGEGLMDTRGLAAFGLPDLQCRFVGLDVGAVGRLLMAYAEYLFEQGDVLHDEALVRGVQSHEEWGCARGRAFALPDREVVSLVPSAPHAPA